MSEKKNILVVDDEEFIRLNLKRIFSEEEYNVILEDTGKGAIDQIKNNKIDIALLDINLPDINGLEVLKQIKEIQPGLLVIMITGYASVESAVNAIKLGAYDYIKKPFKADAIKLITRLALETQTLKKTVEELQKQTQKPFAIDQIIGVSDEIKHMKNQITEFAKYDSETVLITGESGTGKELVASALHNLSPRAGKEFVEINCASIPETLLESELFGYEKGAFTDAKGKKHGLLEKANGGTLFLDEIGEMSMPLQAKLLRLIENKKFRRLGSTEDIHVDIRIIAATNKDLKKAIEENQFRKDLYYRLNVLRIEVPPLRKRRDDILILASYFLDYFNKKFSKEINDFSEEAKNIMLNYHWPGNVRELKNSVERICILQKKPLIEAEDLPKEWLEKTPESNSNLIPDKIDFNKYSYNEILYNIEKQLLQKAFNMYGQNTSQTARALKLPRETLRDKLAKYNIVNGEK